VFLGRRLKQRGRHVRFLFKIIGGELMLLLPINVLVVIVVGAICFYLIDRFVRDGRLENLLKILVVLICLASIVQRVLPALGVNF
jgi:hypothetical protein